MAGKKGREGGPWRERSHDDLGRDAPGGGPVTEDSGADEEWRSVRGVESGGAAFNSQATHRPSAIVHDNRPAWLVDVPWRPLGKGCRRARARAGSDRGGHEKAVVGRAGSRPRVRGPRWRQQTRARCEWPAALRPPGLRGLKAAQ